MNQEPYYQQLLKTELDRRHEENEKFSLRAFANYLEIDPGALSKILSGKKLLTPPIAEKVISKLELTPEEKREFLFSMARSYEETGRKRKGPVINKLILKQDPEKILGKELDPKTYSIISNWYFYAILQLVESKHFTFRYSWIASELGITKEQAKEAIDTLIEQKLLKEELGVLSRTYDKVHSGDQYYTNEAFRNRIKQVTIKSLEALDNTPVSLRGHNTITMSIDPRKIDIAKFMIREFMSELSTVLETKKEKVYELQVNLFPLQKMNYE